MPRAAPTADARAPEVDEDLEGPLFADVAPKEATLLEAALDLFVERGFHGTTIPEIARRAGVATGSVYTYFDGKEALVNALLARIRARLARALAARVARARGTRAEHAAIWGVFAGFALAHERAIAFVDLHHHAPYVTAETAAAWAPARALLDAHFARGAAEGTYRDAPPALLRAITCGALLGVHKLSRAGELALSRETLARAHEAAWAAVVAPGRGRRASEPSRSRARPARRSKA